MFEFLVTEAHTKIFSYHTNAGRNQEEWRRISLKLNARRNIRTHNPPIQFSEHENAINQSGRRQFGPSALFIHPFSKFITDLICDTSSIFLSSPSHL